MSSVVFFSGGVCSFLAAKRWIEAGNKPVLLFSDTGIEDADLYRFVEETAKFLGAELVTLGSDETFDEMIVRHRALPNDRMPFCSHERKVEPAVQWLKARPEITDLVFGLDWTEPHRLPKVQSRWKGHTCHAPMMSAPHLTKRQMFAEVEALGIRIPRLYTLGFQHNNCGGGCVRNGLKAWRHLREQLPDVYEAWAKREELIPGYSFSRDRRNGEAKPITLRQIATDADADRSFDWGGCGCFIEEGSNV